MAQIKGTDIIEQGALNEHISQVDQLTKELKELDNVYKSIAKSQAKALQANTGKTAKEINSINKAVTESNKMRQNSVTVNKQLAKSEEALARALSKENKQIQANRIATQEANKAARDSIKRRREELGSLNRLRATLNAARKRFDALSKSEQENARIGGRLQKVINNTDAQVRKLEMSTGRAQRNVGNYGSAFKGAANQLKNFATALGVVGGVRLLTNVIRDSFNVIKDFDSAIGNLGAIGGLTASELAPLEAQAKALGASTRFTASEVANLQLELTKLGFAPGQIMDMAEPILNLSSALGADLPTAAALTGAVLNQFALDASEAGRVTDVLVAAANNAAVDFEFFNNAMSTIGPTANAVGVSLEETSALLATLANSGLDSSTSATGLRNIFLDLNKAGLTLPEALEKIRSSTDQAGTSFDLFGKRGATLGVILANNEEATAGLEQTLLNAGGTAQEVADKQLDTLQGSLDLLRSAWEGYILGADGAGGITDKLKGIVQFLANNLETILNTIILLVKGFVSYKVGVFVATTATKLFNAATNKSNKGLASLIKNVGLNPFGILAAGITLLLPALIDAGKELFGFNEQLDVLEEVQQEVNAQLAEEKAALKELGIALNNTTTASVERGEILKQINATYDVTLENLEDEAEFLKQIEGAYRDIIKALEDKIRADVRRAKLTEEIEKEFEILQKIEEFGEIQDLTGPQRALVADLNEKLEETRRRIEKLGGEIAAQDLVVETTIDGEECPEGFEKDENGVCVPKTGKPRGTITQSIELTREAEKEEEAAFKRKQQRDQDVLDQEKENAQIRIDFEQKTAEEIKRINEQQEKDDLARLAEKKRIAEEERKQREQQIKDLKKLAKDTINVFKGITDGLDKEIDSRIAAQQREVDASRERINNLTALAAGGNLQASESIKAEEQRAASAQGEIEELERKKRNLLVITTSLNALNAAIENGDTNAFANVSNQLTSFLQNLPKFFSGTSGTVADALGHKGIRDGHTVRVHDNEHIIGAKDSDKLHAAGISKTSDIVNGALMYHNDQLLNAQAVTPILAAGYDNSEIVAELSAVKGYLKDLPNQIPVQEFNYDVVKGVVTEEIKRGNFITVNKHHLRGRL